MKLVATKELRYAGRMLKAGDAFEASDKHGKLLKAIGKAQDAPARKPKPEKTPAVSAPDAAPDAGGALFSEAPAYLRRDLRAED